MSTNSERGGGRRRVDGTLYRGNMRKKSVADALLRGEKEEREEYRLGGGSYPTRGGVGGTYKTKLRFLPLYVARDFISILMDSFYTETFFVAWSGKLSHLIWRGTL